MDQAKPLTPKQLPAFAVLTKMISNDIINDNSTLSKTPPNNELAQAALAFLSPMLFKRKQESRFQFAHSVDPIKSCDWDEIQVPAKI